MDFVNNNLYAPLVRLLGMNYFTSMETVEGWALYCEEMMLQQGFYKDAKKTQHLISGIQMEYAMNILFDIQLHCRQRTITEAKETLMNILSYDEKAAKDSVLNITCTPGYPLSYITGKLLIDDLRREVEEKMGNKFSLKFFHDTILRCGDLPYHLLKDYFEEKIKNL